MHNRRVDTGFILDSAVTDVRHILCHIRSAMALSSMSASPCSVRGNRPPSCRPGGAKAHYHKSGAGLIPITGWSARYLATFGTSPSYPTAITISSARREREAIEIHPSYQSAAPVRGNCGTRHRYHLLELLTVRLQRREPLTPRLKIV